MKTEGFVLYRPKDLQEAMVMASGIDHMLRVVTSKLKHVVMNGFFALGFCFAGTDPMYCGIAEREYRLAPGHYAAHQYFPDVPYLRSLIINPWHFVTPLPNRDQLIIRYGNQVRSHATLITKYRETIAARRDEVSRRAANPAKYDDNLRAFADHTENELSRVNNETTPDLGTYELPDIWVCLDKSRIPLVRFDVPVGRILEEVEKRRPADSTAHNIQGLSSAGTPPVPTESGVLMASAPAAESDLQPGTRPAGVPEHIHNYIIQKIGHRPRIELRGSDANQATSLIDGAVLSAGLEWDRSYELNLQACGYQQEETFHHNPIPWPGRQSEPGTGTERTESTQNPDQFPINEVFLQQMKQILVSSGKYSSSDIDTLPLGELVRLMAAEESIIGRHRDCSSLIANGFDPTIIQRLTEISNQNMSLLTNQHIQQAMIQDMRASSAATTAQVGYVAQAVNEQGQTLTQVAHTTAASANTLGTVTDQLTGVNAQLSQSASLINRVITTVQTGALSRFNQEQPQITYLQTQAQGQALAQGGQCQAGPPGMAPTTPMVSQQGVAAAAVAPGQTVQTGFPTDPRSVSLSQQPGTVEHRAMRFPHGTWRYKLHAAMASRACLPDVRIKCSKCSRPACPMIGAGNSVYVTCCKDCALSNGKRHTRKCNEYISGPDVLPEYMVDPPHLANVDLPTGTLPPERPVVQGQGVVQAANPALGQFGCQAAPCQCVQQQPPQQPMPVAQNPLTPPQGLPTAPTFGQPPATPQPAPSNQVGGQPPLASAAGTPWMTPPFQGSIAQGSLAVPGVGYGGLPPAPVQANPGSLQGQCSNQAPGGMTNPFGITSAPPANQPPPQPAAQTGPATSLADAIRNQTQNAQGGGQSPLMFPNQANIGQGNQAPAPVSHPAGTPPGVPVNTAQPAQIGLPANLFAQMLGAASSQPEAITGVMRAFRPT